MTHRDYAEAEKPGLSRRDLALGAAALAGMVGAGFGISKSNEKAARTRVSALDSLVVPGLPGLVGPNGWPTPGLSMAALRGRVALVHAFSSWCPVCFSEYDFIKTLGSDPRYVLAGLIVMDREDPARKFIASRGNPHAVLGFDGSGEAARRLRIGAVPRTIVFDGQGRIVETVPGSLSAGYFREKVEPAIARALRA
ncbi:MAG: redoxin family protein [Beijerinckiaceae bacterium]|nr:redoxin family protein [Beijerinckiaceae bacterium]